LQQAVESATTAVSALTTDVESVVAEFSVEVPVLHEAKVKAIAKTKINFFIFNGFILCLQLTYEDLRFLISLFIFRKRSVTRIIGQRTIVAIG
jgi:hypothetical protein